MFGRVFSGADEPSFTTDKARASNDHVMEAQVEAGVVQTQVGTEDGSSGALADLEGSSARRASLPARKVSGRRPSRRTYADSFKPVICECHSKHRISVDSANAQIDFRISSKEQRTRLQTS